MVNLKEKKKRRTPMMLKFLEVMHSSEWFAMTKAKERRKVLTWRKSRSKWNQNQVMDTEIMTTTWELA